MDTTKGLKDKTVVGIGWSAVDSLASQGITFLVGIVLARLLSPAEYGLIGIITIFISISNTIVDSGFSNSLIRKPEILREDYSTTFVFNIILSVVMYFFLFACAPAISYFFHQEQLVSLTRVLGIVVVINSLAIVQRTKLVREIDFKRQAKISVLASTISGIVGIALAASGLGVWALVAQQISRQVVNTAGLWISAKWSPSLSFSIISFKYQFQFGWKLLLSQLLNTIWNEASHIVIGRCYSSATLGQYSRAQQFSTLFSSNMTSIIQRVSFPVLSSIQKEKERLKNSYKKLIKTTMLLSFTGMLALAACSKPLIFVLIGEKWEQAASFLPILCFNFMFYPIRAINTNMLQVVGRTDQILILEIIKKIIYLIPICLGIFVGIYWMLWGNVIAGVIGYVMNSHFSGKYIHYTISQQVVDILPSLLFGLVVAVGMYVITLFSLSNILTLILQLIVGFSLIFILGEATKLEPYRELKGIVISTLSKVRKH